jgi:hypothetical protein
VQAWIALALVLGATGCLAERAGLAGTRRDASPVDDAGADAGAPMDAPPGVDAMSALDAGPPDETCNGIDDDGNGLIDDLAGCLALTDCDHHGSTAGGGAFFVCSAGRDWDAAFEHCDTFGYHLVVVTDDAENSLWRETAEDVAPGMAWWLGLADADADGTYEDDEWVTGSSSYRRWMSGEPDQAGERAALRGADGLWIDDGRFESHGFLCEVP